MVLPEQLRFPGEVVGVLEVLARENIVLPEGPRFLSRLYLKVHHSVFYLES